MRAILGAVSIKRLPADGTLNLGSLWTGDEGFGTMDGLVFGKPDDKTHVILTTELIFRSRLRSHKDWWGDKIRNVPQVPTEAMASMEFYTQASI
jgi:hypothetical protein